MSRKRSTFRASPFVPAITAPCRFTRRLGLTASTRASFYLYNTVEEVGRLASGLREARRILSR